MSYQALNLVIHLPMDTQIRLLGGLPPNTPWKEWYETYAVAGTGDMRKEFLRMSEFLFFIIGAALGGLMGVVMMCCLQINRLSKRKEYADAKKECADIVPADGGRS